MKIYTLFLMLCLLPFGLWAQGDQVNVNDISELEDVNSFEKDTTLNYLDPDSTWWSSIQFGLNFNQSSFSANWTGGGVNAFANSSLFNYQLHYLQDPWSWDNQIELLYGVIKNSGQKDIRKSQDRIYLDTKAGYQLSEYWNAFLAVNFLTQFAPGYRYVDLPQGGEDASTISRFMAPAFLTTSVGFEYKPAAYFWLRLSPLAPRLTFVTDTELYANTEGEKNYGVPIGETVRKEWLALQILAELNKNLTERINIQTRYMLFANYEELAFDSLDHRLDILFNAKLTQFLNFSIGTIMLYDIDQDNDLQISQSLGIGLLLQK